jgi:PAS domain S-box-containing protein
MNLSAVNTNIALAIAYAAAGTATLAFGAALGPDLSTMLWIGSGIALAAALLAPFPVWPGVVAGAMAVTLWEGAPLGHVLATGVANGGEVAVAVRLLRNAGFDRAFGTVRDVLLFVGLACGLAAAVAAVVSVASLIVAGGANPSAFGRIWPMWWLTHGMGMLVVVPVSLIVWSGRLAATRTRLGEGAIYLAVIAVAASISFLAPANSLRAELFFLPLPVLLLSAVRGDQLVATLGGLITTSLAIVGALVARGPFSAGTNIETLFLTWSFTAVSIIATVIATAVVRERRLAQTELESGERRLRTVLEATTDGILVADSQGRVTDVNSAFLRMLDLGEDWKARPGDDVRTFLGKVQPALEGEDRTIPDALNPEIPAHRTAHEEVRLADDRVVEAESLPLPSSPNEPGRVWSLRDITQRVKSEEERRQLHERILHSQKLEGLGVLAGGVAHDFNNVLAGIIGYAELLLRQPGIDDQGRADAKGIIKASQHAAGLCGQLLTYAGKTTAVLAPVDLAASVQEMRHFMALSLPKSVDLAVEVPDQPVIALVDDVQIRQVIFNLVTNASEAILEHRASGRVLVRVESKNLSASWTDRAYGADDLRDGAYAVVEVEDDGIGLDAEDVTRIFDPFYSSKGPARGLGLSSVLGVLRSHSGGLQVHTEAGLGTRFQIALPAAEPSALEAAHAPGRRISADDGPATILVVDDEAMVRETVVRMLESDGHRVLQAVDGNAALALLDDHALDIDLVVLDLTMPHRDGLATLTEMRRRQHLIPVLLASGYSGEAVPPDAAVAGFIQKPYRSADLRERVKAALRQGPATA